MSAQEAFNEHLIALSQGMDAFMAGYAEDTVLITPEVTVRGKEAAREFLTQFFKSLPEDWASKVALHKTEFVGDFLYVTWSAKPYLPLVTDSFLFQDDLIVVQCVTPAATPNGA
jgi:ketosteroid isomerase-like protein